MRRSKWLLVTLFLLSVCCAGLFCACGSKHEHTFSKDWEHNATEHWHVATCDDTEETSERGPHDWDDGVVTTPATCSAPGEKTTTCKTCGATKKETIRMDETAHVWKDDVAVVPATCKAAGSKTYTCSLCGTTKTETIEKDENAHVWNDGVVKTPATCQKEGVKTYTCTLCGTSADRNYSDPEAHVWDDGTYVEGKEATCSDPGEKLFSCTLCTATKVGPGEIDPDAHKFTVAGDYLQFQDCTTDGIQEWKCEYCEETETRTLPAYGHTFGGEWYYDAGVHYQKCTNQNTKEDHTDVRGNVAAHTIVEGNCETCDYEQVENLLKYDIVGTVEEEKYAKITGYAEGVTATDIADLYIPDTLGGYPVREVADGTTTSGPLHTNGSMHSISIPATLTKFGAYCFRENSSIKYIYFRGTLEQWLSIEAEQFASHPLDNGTSGHLDKHLYIGGTLVTEVTIPASVTAIPRHAFYYLPDITSITIPATVKTVGDYAFEGCSGVEELNIASGVTQIGRSAFAYMTNLETLVLPASVTSIGESAVRGCTGLTSLTLPFVGSSGSAKNQKGLIGYIFDQQTSSSAASEGCVCIRQFSSANAGGSYYAQVPASLKTVTVLGGTPSIGAFSGMTMLTSVTLPDSATVVPSRCFQNCENLTSVHLSPNTTQLGCYAFDSCKVLPSVDLGSKLQTIGVGAFSSCKALTEIEIPATLTAIGKAFDNFTAGGTGVFSYCTITKVTISSIDAWCDLVFPLNSDNPLSGGAALYLNDTLVEEVTVPDSAELHSYAFANCTSIKKIVISAGVKTVYRNAFYKLTNVKIEFKDPTGWTLFDSDFFTDTHDLGAVDQSKLTGEVDVSLFNGGEFDWKYLHKKDA